MDDLVRIPKRIALYLRVSTTDQVDMFGLDLQREAIMSLIKSRANSDEPYVFAGEEHVYVDDISGTTRPEERLSFSRMMDAIRFSQKGSRPFDAVAVYRIDRFARRLEVLLGIMSFFRDNEVQFVSVNESFDTSTPFGRATLNIIGAFAELERDTIADRMFSGRISATRQGIHMGTSAKFGYKKSDDKRLQILKEEADVVTLIFELFTVQKMSVYEISSYLNEKEYPTPDISALKHKKHKGISKIKGKKPRWYPENIRKMLADEIYIGRSYYGRTKRGKSVPKSEWIEVPVPPIIEEYIFAKARAIAEETKHYKPETKSRHRYLLGGLLHCDTCQREHHMRRFAGIPQQSGKNGRVHYYVCKGRSKLLEEPICPVSYIAADPIEEYVVTLCKNILSNPIHTFKYHQSLESTRANTKRLQREKNQLVNLIDALPQRVRQLRLHNDVGAIDEAGFRKEYAELKEGEKKQKKRLEEIEMELSQSELSESYIKTFEYFNAEYRNKLNDLMNKREEASEVIHRLIEKIVVYSRPVEESDHLAGRKKKEQRVASRIHIKFKLPQEILQEVSAQEIEKAPSGGASSSYKSNASAR